MVDLIQEELIRVREELKQFPEAELEKYGSNMLERSYKIFDAVHPMLAWSVRDDDGSLVFVIELRKKTWFGSVKCQQSGFRVSQAGIQDLTEAQLWEYD